MDAFDTWLNRMNEPLTVTLTTADLQALTNALALAIDSIAQINGDDLEPMQLGNLRRWKRDPHGLVDAEADKMDDLYRRLLDITDRNLKSRRTAYRAAMDELDDRLG